MIDLFREFLEFYQMEYTLAVFLSEAKLQHSRVKPRIAIQDELSLVGKR